MYLIILYFTGVFIGFFFTAYNEEYHTTKTTNWLCLASIFWPISLILYVACLPFVILFLFAMILSWIVKDYLNPR